MSDCFASQYHLIGLCLTRGPVDWWLLDLDLVILLYVQCMLACIFVIVGLVLSCIENFHINIQVNITCPEEVCKLKSFSDL